jgi:hypothetical protein
MNSKVALMSVRSSSAVVALSNFNPLHTIKRRKTG